MHNILINKDFKWLFYVWICIYISKMQNWMTIFFMNGSFKYTIKIIKEAINANATISCERHTPNNNFKLFSNLVVIFIKIWIRWGFPSGNWTSLHSFQGKSIFLFSMLYSYFSRFMILKHRHDFKTWVFFKVIQIKSGSYFLLYPSFSGFMKALWN